MQVDNLNKLNISQYISELEKDGIAVEFAGAETAVEFTGADTVVEYISYDSRDVRPGTLFIAKGAHFKQAYLEDAIAKGATAYLSDQDYGVDIPLVKVNDLRRAMAVVAYTFFARPQDKLKIIGITGTKGKTTTSSALNEILRADAKGKGKKFPAFISSIYNYDGYEEVPSDLTTPETIELFYILHRAVSVGLETVVMEVSSQALKYHRVYGIEFEYGIFINIAPDHISDAEHSSFDDYFSSKLLLLERSKRVIVNLDTDYLDRVLAAYSGDELITVRLNDDKDSGETADYFIDKYEIVKNGMSFSSSKNFAGQIFATEAQGTYNILNFLIAMTVAEQLGVDTKYMQTGLDDLDISSRTTVVKNADETVVFLIDAAHNGLSFEAVYDSAEKFYADYRRVSVFGTVGNKAENRREEMAKASNEGHIEHVYLTQDDNDYESVEKINQEIISHLNPEKLTWNSTQTRDEAFALAYADAQRTYAEEGRQTLVLALGKGTENYMKINGEYKKFPGDKALIEAIID